jgi:hypothetical protein
LLIVQGWLLLCALASGTLFAPLDLALVGRVHVRILPPLVLGILPPLVLGILRLLVGRLMCYLLPLDGLRLRVIAGRHLYALLGKMCPRETSESRWSL